MLKHSEEPLYHGVEGMNDDNIKWAELHKHSNFLDRHHLIQPKQSNGTVQKNQVIRKTRLYTCGERKRMMISNPA